MICGNYRIKRRKKNGNSTRKKKILEGSFSTEKSRLEESIQFMNGTIKSFESYTKDSDKGVQDFKQQILKYIRDREAMWGNCVATNLQKIKFNLQVETKHQFSEHRVRNFRSNNSSNSSNSSTIGNTTLKTSPLIPNPVSFVNSFTFPIPITLPIPIPLTNTSTTTSSTTSLITMSNSTISSSTFSPADFFAILPNENVEPIVEIEVDEILTEMKKRMIEYYVNHYGKIANFHAGDIVIAIKKALVGRAGFCYEIIKIPRNSIPFVPTSVQQPQQQRTSLALSLPDGNKDMPYIVDKESTFQGPGPTNAYLIRGKIILIGDDTSDTVRHPNLPARTAIQAVILGEVEVLMSEQQQ